MKFGLLFFGLICLILSDSTQAVVLGFVFITIGIVLKGKNNE